ncbi:MAG: NAD(P)H-dependent oxidoreductase [Caulobacter sp.]|nr:NAD(P)H-dependent oxidoreductase [Vitreoscilla sp.]
MRLMADVLVLVAHPDIARSRVNRALAAQARLLRSGDVEVRDLYALYPDYVIDVEAEQAALAAARTVVWVHPVQWYSMPALLKLWMDEVLAFRWAYGPGGRALVGKCAWLVVSTGGVGASYLQMAGAADAFERFLAPYRQTAGTVGMRFLDPLVFHGAHRAEAHEVHAHAHGFAQRLIALAGEARASIAPTLPDVAPDERRVTTDD